MTLFKGDLILKGKKLLLDYKYSFKRRKKKRNGRGFCLENVLDDLKSKCPLFVHARFFLSVTRIIFAIIVVIIIF